MISLVHLGLKSCIFASKLCRSFRLGLSSVMGRSHTVGTLSYAYHGLPVSACSTRLPFSRKEHFSFIRTKRGTSESKWYGLNPSSRSFATFTSRRSRVLEYWLSSCFSCLRTWYLLFHVWQHVETAIYYLLLVCLPSLPEIIDGTCAFSDILMQISVRWLGERSIRHRGSWSHLRQDQQLPTLTLPTQMISSRFQPQCQT